MEELEKALAEDRAENGGEHPAETSTTRRFLNYARHLLCGSTSRSNLDPDSSPAFACTEPRKTEKPVTIGLALRVDSPAASGSTRNVGLPMIC